MNILWEFKVLSRFMQKWIQPPSCLDYDHVLKPRPFPPNRAPKMRERHQLFFGLRLVSKESCNPDQNRAAFWRIFSSNKSAPAKRKTGFYANHDPNKQEVGFIFAWSSPELWSLLKYSRVKKIKNPYRLMAFSRPIQWCHSHVDPVWPDGTFKSWWRCLWRNCVLSGAVRYCGQPDQPAGGSRL